MITFPAEFVATKYPGYFWNTKTKRLFSCKSGELREMVGNRPNHWNNYFDGWQVSHRGKKRKLYMDYLMKLQPADTTFPVVFTMVKSDVNQIPIDFKSLPVGTIITITVGGTGG